MAKPFTVVIIEPVNISLPTFTLWLQGHSIADATRKRMTSQSESSLMGGEFNDYPSLLYAETEEMYHLFNSIEPYLQSPSTFLNQRVFQIPHTLRQEIIELYYNFDEPVVREFLGKKLSGKNRKDLDDVSEKTKTSLRSCKRQFDNIKQVLRVVDDFEGSLVENIKAHFHLSESLSQSYASLVFLSHNRFETGKKKMSHLTVRDFTLCANLMIEQWTSGSYDTHRLVDDDLELDRYFLQELHDLKLKLIDRIWIEHHQKLVCRDLKRKHVSQWLIRSVEGNFKTLSRSLTTIGSSLIHSKDLKDFFVDLIEKVIEPFMAQKWSQDDLDVVLVSFNETFIDCETSHTRRLLVAKDRGTVPWSDTYLRYMHVVKDCVLILYHH